MTLVAVILGFALAATALAQTLTVAISEGMPGFDPGANNRTVASQVYPNIFDTLVAKNGAGELIPSLATSWESAGPTSWRLQLRDDVTWHDGQPFTAADVEFTIERIATTPELARHVLFQGVTDVEVVNDHEVVIHTELADPLMPNNLAANGAQILPKHYVESAGIDVASVTPIGTGPYRFVEYRPDDRLILTAYADHWRGTAAYPDVVFRIIGENTTAVSELITDGVQLSAVDAADRERVTDSGTATVVSTPTNRVVHWTFNTSEGLPTSDQRVREAIDLAIDDSVFVEVLQDGLGAVTRARTGPGDNFAPSGLYGTFLYDPDRAVELLAEAGYGPGELEITLMGGTEANDRAELTSAMLEAVGIVPSIELFESSVWSSRYWNTGEFVHMAAVGSSNSTFDYGSTLTDLVCPSGVHSFRSHWCNEEFSALVVEANSELDAARRQQLLDQATAILMTERPQIYMYNTVNFLGIANSVAFTPRADGLLFMYDAAPAQ
jgi:peptide/nickel transport system substrate-binding protein